MKKLTFLVFVFSLLPSLSFAYSVNFNTPDECVIKDHIFHVESEWSSLVASNDIYWKVCHDYIINGHIVDSKCSEWKNSVTKVAFGCDFSAREGNDQKVRTRLLKKVNDNQHMIDSEEASITICKMSDYYTKEQVEQNITDIRSYIQQHEAEWKKDEVGGGISLHTVERWFKETWQSVIEWVESKVNWLLEKVNELLKWREEANTKLAEMEARVRYLERVCEKLMETREQEKYEDIVAVMVENNLSELRVGNAVCEVEENKYVCIERLK